MSTLKWFGFRISGKDPWLAGVHPDYFFCHRPPLLFFFPPLSMRDIFVWLLGWMELGAFTLVGGARWVD